MSQIASNPNSDGNLSECAYCGGVLRVVGGTDPNESGDGFAETYKCQSGHTGTYTFEYDGAGGTNERYTGACKNKTR